MYMENLLVYLKSLYEKHIAFVAQYITFLIHKLYFRNKLTSKRWNERIFFGKQYFTIMHIYFLFILFVPGFFLFLRVLILGVWRITFQYCISLMYREKSIAWISTVTDLLMLFF